MNWGEIIRTDGRIFGLILGLSVILYHGTLFNGYSVDDHLVSDGLEMVDQGLSGIPEIFTSYYSITDLGTPFEYRPITRVTFAIERAIWGEVLWLSHLLNIILYASVVYLMFRFLVKLTGVEHRNILLLTTLLFLVHPVHSEAVCSLKNREELLSLLLAMVSSIWLLRYANSLSLKWLAGSILVFGLSLLTKPAHVPFAGVMVLGAILFGKATLKRSVILGLPYFVLFAVFYVGVTHFFPQYLRTEFAYEESPLTHVPNLIDRLPTVFSALYHNIELLVFPHPLAFFYGFDQIPISSWNDTNAIVGVLLTFMLIVLIAITWKRQPMITLGIGILVMCISPFINVIGGIPGIIAERWLLAPSIGYCLILATVIDLTFRMGARSLGWLALIPVLLLSAAKIYSRVPDWNSKRSLVYKDVKSVPRSFVANFMAAELYKEDARNALTEIERIRNLTLSLESNMALAEISTTPTRYLLRCASQNLELGNTEQAGLYAHQAYKSAPENFNFGMKALELLLISGQSSIGLEVSNGLTNAFPNNSGPIIFSGNFHLMNRDTLEAIKHFDNALLLADADHEALSYFVSDLQRAISISE